MPEVCFCVFVSGVTHAVGAFLPPSIRKYWTNAGRGCMVLRGGVARVVNLCTQRWIPDDIKNVDKCQAGQPFKEGIVIGKGRRATGSAVAKVASVAIPKTPTDSSVDIPDCFGSTDPLHLWNSSWEEETEGGFIELLEEAGIPKIPLNPVKPRIDGNEVEVINGIPDGEMKWKLLKVDIPKRNLALRDPHVKRM